MVMALRVANGVSGTAEAVEEHAPLEARRVTNGGDGEAADFVDLGEASAWALEVTDLMDRRVSAERFC